MSAATANNRLEMFLALNAEAFNKGLNAAGSSVSHLSGNATSAFAKTKDSLGENVTTINKYNDGLRNQGGILQTLGGHVGALVGAMAASFSVLAGMEKLVEVAREFDKINAGLITATGSTEKAKVAFAAIQDFAAKTPYGLNQVSESFIKLVNFGLDPSERALKSYGNSSSALGKDLNQMIEAVADAATGEFERLKEFGIKSKSEGDKVSFTFRGVTETVGKNAKEIEEYLIRLGEVNFADAMANRMATLDGAMSNLGDAWNKLFLSIAQSGVGDEITKVVRAVTSGLDEISAMLTSGQLVAALQAYLEQWKAWGDDVVFTINYVYDIFAQTFGSTSGALKGDWQATIGFLIDAFKQFPENIRALVGLVTVYVASSFDEIKAKVTWLIDSVKAIFTDKTLEEASDAYLQQIKNINEAREESLDIIEKERSAATNSYDQQIDKAQELRREYDKTQEAGKNAAEDRLKEFRVADDSDIDAKEAQKKQSSAAVDETKATIESLAAAEQEWKEIEAKRDLTTDEKRKRSKEKAQARELEAQKAELEEQQNSGNYGYDPYYERESGPPRDPNKIYVTETWEEETVDATQKQEEEYAQLFAANAAREKEGIKKSTGSISAHGGALTEEEWQSLTKAQQDFLVADAMSQHSSYDYFSNKTGDRFKNVISPELKLDHLAQAALQTLGQNQRQEEQKAWLADVVNYGLQNVAMLSMQGSGMFGDIPTYVNTMLSTMDEDGNLKQQKTTQPPPSNIHELKFTGGSLTGSQTDIDALLDLLAQAGMSAA